MASPSDNIQCLQIWGNATVGDWYTRTHAEQAEGKKHVDTGGEALEQVDGSDGDGGEHI